MDTTKKRIDDDPTTRFDWELVKSAAIQVDGSLNDTISSNSFCPFQAWLAKHTPKEEDEEEDGEDENEGIKSRIHAKVPSADMAEEVVEVEKRGCMAQFGSSKDDDRAITFDQMIRYREDFASDNTGKMAQNALQYNSVHSVTLRRDLIQCCTDFTFSVELDGDGMVATNQKNSGRCWLFAALNLLRISASTILNLDNFEFSESYHFFFDKLEKSNCFLEAIIHTHCKPLDDRTLSLILSDPIPDGGEWTGAISLVTKYGLVPKSAYPETYSSGNTRSMNGVLEDLLIAAACDIRNMLQHGAHVQTVWAYKNKRLDDVWRILCIHLGTPPHQFNWQWRDRNYVFHSYGLITPLDFAAKLGVEIWKVHVPLIQDPRNDPYLMYTVEYSQSMLGGLDMVFLNVTSDELKMIAENMLKDGHPIWFACNVDVEFAEAQGIWDAELYDMESLYYMKNHRMSKADKIRYGYGMGNHAMLLTGVDLEHDDKPRRWRVENSWGKKDGNDGYCTMNDNWFDENVFEIVAHRDYLTEKMRDGLKSKPIVLPAWDAMGNFSRSKCRNCTATR